MSEYDGSDVQLDVDANAVPDTAHQAGDPLTDGGVVETYIGYLRKKLDTGTPRLIHTIRGVGYTLRPPR